MTQTTFSFRPQIMSTRASRYVEHRVPKIAPPTIERMSAKEGIEMLEYMVTTAMGAENEYYRLRKAIKESDRPSAADLTALRKARQTMNQIVSLKTHDLARLMGITEQELNRRHMPRAMTSMWFCGDPSQPHQTPLDFLRMLLCLLRKNGKLYACDDEQ